MQPRGGGSGADSLLLVNDGRGTFACSALRALPPGADLEDPDLALKLHSLFAVDFDRDGKNDLVGHRFSDTLYYESGDCFEGDLNCDKNINSADIDGSVARLISQS